MVVEVGDWEAWVVVFGVMVFQWLLEKFLKQRLAFETRITLGVLKNMRSVKNCKESIRNIFTNLSIVGALVMTISFAMLFLPDHLENLGEDDYDQRLITHGFIAATGYACLQSMRAMVESVLNLIYTEALTSPEVIRFLIQGPAAMGAPVIATTFSMASMLVACTLYILQMYSLAAAAAFIIIAVSRASSLLYLWRKRAKFTTDREHTSAAKWKWAEDGSPPPESIVLKCTEAQIKMLRDVAKMAQEEEAKELTASGAETPNPEAQLEACV